jgi:hypothetical protein
VVSGALVGDSPLSIQQGVDRARRTIDRATLRPSATLLLAGQLLYILVTQFHAGGDANNHPTISVNARSGDWKAQGRGVGVQGVPSANTALIPVASFDGPRKRPGPLTCRDPGRQVCPEGDLNPHAR